MHLDTILCLYYTVSVEPPSKGHFGISHFVLYGEVVLFSWERGPKEHPLLGGCPLPTVNFDFVCSSIIWMMAPILSLQMSGYQSLNGDTKRIYSTYVTKLNRKNRPDSRIYVLCDHHLYRLDTSFKISRRAPIPLGDIKGMSISPGNDQALVIHCSVRFLGL